MLRSLHIGPIEGFSTRVPDNEKCEYHAVTGDHLSALGVASLLWGLGAMDEVGDNKY